MTEEELMVDPYAFCRFLVEYLEVCGAKSYPGPLAVYGGPGNSSAYELLFAEHPKKLIDNALESLSILLEMDYEAGVAKLPEAEKQQAKKGSVIRQELSSMTEREAEGRVRKVLDKINSKPPITPKEYAEHMLGQPLSEDELSRSRKPLAGRGLQPSKSKSSEVDDSKSKRLRLFNATRQLRSLT